MCNAETGKYCKKLKCFMRFYSKYINSFQKQLIDSRNPNTPNKKQKIKHHDFLPRHLHPGISDCS